MLMSEFHKCAMVTWHDNWKRGEGIQTLSLPFSKIFYKPKITLKLKACVFFFVVVVAF